LLSYVKYFILNSVLSLGHKSPLQAEFNLYKKPDSVYRTFSPRLSSKRIKSVIIKHNFDDVSILREQSGNWHINARSIVLVNKRQINKLYN